MCMAPNTGASLSCSSSIFTLFSVLGVTFARTMYKPRTTEIHIRVIAVRDAFNAATRRSRHARAWPIGHEGIGCRDLARTCQCPIRCSVYLTRHPFNAGGTDV